MKRLAVQTGSYSVTGLCRLFGVTKQAYYKHVDNVFARLAHERFLVEYVRTVREIDPGIGGEKLWLMYKNYFPDNHRFGRDAFIGILKAHGLMLRKHRKGCRTTDSNHGLPVYPDLVKNLLLTRPNQVWVSDITYVLTDEGFCYLSIVTDAYTHEVVGWCVGPTLETVYTLEALKMAIHSLQGSEIKLIHHSDRGTQYASLLYTSYLKKQEIQISMTQSGDPKDNAIAERINGILKTEFLNHYQFRDIQQVRLRVSQAIDFYNKQRPHRSLDMMTPVQVKQKTGRIKKRWKSYKDNYRQSGNN